MTHVKEMLGRMQTRADVLFVWSFCSLISRETNEGWSTEVISSQHHMRLVSLFLKAG